MRLSIQRLRWVLIAGAVLLVGVLAVYIGYGRYLALKRYRQIIARSGVSITHDSNGVTYSQSLQGKKIFTIRAKTESSLGDGKYALHNAELLLYNRTTGAAADHIYGSEMEYDQNEGVARAKGEVFMDIQPPQGLANGGHSAVPPTARPAAPAKVKSQPPPVIHVRTSGLVYVRKLGVAATDQQVEFSYGDMTCTAVGAEFNTNGNTLKLLANVHMDGLAHGKPLHVVATRADMSRDENIANLTAPIVTSEDRSMKADFAVLHLRKDGSIETVEGTNHVLLTSATQQITANRLDATLNAQSIPQAAKLTGDVVVVDTSTLRPMHGSASVVDVTMNAEGQPTRVVATGAAKLSMVDRKSNPQGFTRSMDGAKIIALFAPGRQTGQHKESSHLTEIHAVGSAHASGESLATQTKGTVVDSTKPLARKMVQVSADDLRTLFTQTSDRKVHPEKLYGTGHTQLQQDAPLGEQETSTGDTLEINFAPVGAPVGSPSATAENGAMNITSAVQAGNVVIHDRAAAKPGSTEPGATTNGTAERATYDGANQILTLSGSAHLENDNGSIVAPTVSLNQRTQDAEASGGVQAAFQNTPPKTANLASLSPNAKPEPVTHVLAASADFDHATRFATFYGSDAAPARMWQDASQVQAATLLFDGIKRTFSARPGKPDGLVHAIFASNASPPKPGAPARPPSMIRVASPKMDYNDVQREATFSGGVTIDGTMGEVRGQHAVAFLTAAHAPAAKQPAPTSQPSPLNGSIDRVVVYGAVQIDQPGRHGTGEQLLYTAASANYILTGTPSSPPHITDAHQGNVTGATLIFSDAGSTIVVAGDQGAPKGKSGRVHTETFVHPGSKEERR
jgi:lipopolysaccharide export system protein LptA